MLACVKCCSFLNTQMVAERLRVGWRTKKDGRKVKGSERERACEAENGGNIKENSLNRWARFKPRKQLSAAETRRRTTRERARLLPKSLSLSTHKHTIHKDYLKLLERTFQGRWSAGGCWVGRRLCQRWVSWGGGWWVLDPITACANRITTVLPW